MASFYKKPKASAFGFFEWVNNLDEDDTNYYREYDENGNRIRLFVDENCNGVLDKGDWNYYYDFEAEQDIGKQAKISCENGRFVFECTFQCSKSDHYVLTQAVPYSSMAQKYRRENIFLDGKILEGHYDAVHRDVMKNDHPCQWD